MIRRREFILGAASVAGSLYAQQLRAQTPCPAVIVDADSPTNCPLPDGEASLSDAAAQLSPGQWSLDPITWNPSNDQYDISWQGTTGFWDDVRRELHYMGKAQTGGEARHFIYSEQTDTWRQTGSDVAPGKFGHVWGVTFDHTDDVGDYYYIEQDPDGGAAERSLHHMDRSIENGQGQTNAPWTVLPIAGFDIWSPGQADIYQGTPGFHPNLMGPGKPGIYCRSVVQHSYYDKRNEEWAVASSFGSAPYSNKHQTTAIYVPGKDILVFGDGREGDLQYMIIRAGDADNPTPDLEAGPVNIFGQAGDTCGKLIVDPRDDSVIMVLDSRTGAVWTNANGGVGADWVEESFTHPFWANNPYKSTSDSGSFTVCSISRYGCILGMSSYESGGGSILWRPGRNEL